MAQFSGRPVRDRRALNLIDVLVGVEVGNGQRRQEQQGIDNEHQAIPAGKMGDAG